MVQRDYFIRQVEEMGRVIGKIISDLLGLKKQGMVSDAFQFVNHSLKQEIALNLEELLELPLEEMLNQLKVVNGFSDENLESLAELMAETASVNDPKTDKTVTRKLNERALGIFQVLNERGSSYVLSRENHIRNLKKSLNRQ